MEIYSSQNPEKLILQIDTFEINLLEDCLNELALKTGLIIDQYKDHKIYPDHLKIILDCLEKKIFLFEKKYNFNLFYKKLKEIHNVIDSVYKNGDNLILIGD